MPIAGFCGRTPQIEPQGCVYAYRYRHAPPSYNENYAPIPKATASTRQPRLLEPGCQFPIDVAPHPIGAQQGWILRCPN